MRNLKKLSLQKEVTKEAEQIEKEVNSHTELDDLKVSDEMETSLFNKIQEYEYDKRFKVVYHKKKRRYLVMALAAVIVLVLGSAMTGVGSKSYWKVILERVMGDASASVTNVEDMESQRTADLDEVGVYREINEKFGVTPVRLKYKPPGTVLNRCIMDETQNRIVLFYEYENEIIRYTMYMNDTDSSFTQKDLDSLIDEYIIQVDNVDIQIEEYEVNNSLEKRLIAEFEYKDIQYQLKAIMEKEEFNKIIENLYFL